MNNNLSIRLASISIITLLTSQFALFAEIPAVVNLKTDSRVRPIGLEAKHLRFSWELAHPGLQTAWHIQVAKSELDAVKNEWTHWDSGWREGADNQFIRDEGELPTSGQPLWWRVRIRDQKGEESPWSEATSIEMGLLKESDWQNAKWIGCDRPMDAPQLAPTEIMGSWIGCTEGVSNSYTFELQTPDSPVVSAMAYWGVSTPGTSAIAFIRSEISKGQGNRIARPSRGFVDLSYQIKQGLSNRLVLELRNPKPDTKITFGMRLVTADGQEQIIRSDANWKSQPNQNVEVAANYGEDPYGQAVVFSRTQLAPVWIRKTIPVKASLQRARLYLSALGHGDSTVNGVAVSDDLLSPAQTDYEDFAYYVAHDITSHLNEGENVLAVLLNSGWYDQVGGFGTIMSYGRPGLKALVRLDYQNGETHFITSDESWQYKESGLRSANVYLGERMDYRFEHDQWKTPEPCEEWNPVQQLPPLTPRLIASDLPPVQRLETIMPTSTQIGKKTWLFDLGANCTGWLKLKFSEPEGHVIRIRYTEFARDNRLDNIPASHWTCHAMGQNETIISDGKPHTYESRFCYKGFRYFEISGLSQPPSEEDVVVYRVGSDAEKTATFESSDPMLNHLFANGMRSHYGNMVNNLLDCPHREKCLWGGDLHASWAFGFHAIDPVNFYRHQSRVGWTGRMHAKNVPGSVMVGQRITENTSSFNWSVSPLFITWWLYQHAGDRETAREFYQPMRGFLQYYEQHSKDGIPDLRKLADHASPLGIPREAPNLELIAALNFFAAAQRFATMAQSLGEEADARWARDLAEQIRSTIATFYRPSKHTFGNGTQDSLALAFGVFDDPEEVKRLATSLAGYYTKNGYKFDGGFLSYWIYPMLSRHGHGDVALKMIRNIDYPGPAWSIAQHDATTYWERYSFNEGLWENRSHNHHAIDHPSAWLVTDLAGIRLDDAQPGCRQIVLAPCLPDTEPLEWVCGSMKTANGWIKSYWKKEGETTRWEFTVPPNTTATLKIKDGITIKNEATQEHFTTSNDLRLKPGSYAAVIP